MNAVFEAEEAGVVNGLPLSVDFGVCCSFDPSVAGVLRSEAAGDALGDDIL